MIKAIFVSSVADLRLWRWALLSHLCDNDGESVKDDRTSVIIWGWNPLGSAAFLFGKGDDGGNDDDNGLWSANLMLVELCLAEKKFYHDWSHAPLLFACRKDVTEFFLGISDSCYIIIITTNHQEQVFKPKQPFRDGWWEFWIKLSKAARDQSC